MTEKDSCELEEHLYTSVWMNNIHALKILSVWVGENAVKLVYQWVLVDDINASMGVYNGVSAANYFVCSSYKQQQHFPKRNIWFLWWSQPKTGNHSYYMEIVIIASFTHASEKKYNVTYKRYFYRRADNRYNISKDLIYGYDGFYFR